MARAFNGTTATVAVDAAHLTQPGIAFSIAAWIKTAAANGEVYGEGNSGAAGPFFQVTTDGTGQVILVAARTASSGGADTLTGAAVVGNSAWHHVCVTQTSANLIALYIDGAADGTKTRTALSTGVQTFNRARFGSLQRNVAGNFFNGSIAHGATWLRQLVANEVASLAAGLLPSHLAPDFYWPLYGTDAPEPDYGTATHLNGTVLNATAANGPPSGLSLLTLTP